MRGSVVTFVTMSYLIVLNPLILDCFIANGSGAKTDVTGAVLAVPPALPALPALPDSVVGVPDLSLVGAVSFGAFARLDVITVVLLVFTLVLADFFDVMGTMTALGKQAGFVVKDGQLPNVGRVLVVEGVDAVAGGVASSSSNTVFVESASGIAEAARTGLANVFTGVLFLLAMFFTPLYAIMRQITEIDFSEFRIALPAFMTIVTMPFTYSIANGIGAGFISWVVPATATVRARTVQPLMWVVAVAFAAHFAVSPLRALLGG